MLMQISVLISAYQMPSTRVQPLVGRPASIGGRAMPLRMHQAEAPLRRALHTIVLTTHAHARVLRAVSEWSVASQFRALGRCHAPQSGARRLLQQHMVRRPSASHHLSPPETHSSRRAACRLAGMLSRSRSSWAWTTSSPPGYGASPSSSTVMRGKRYGIRTRGRVRATPTPTPNPNPNPNQAVCVRDSCPHRSAPLSMGDMKDGTLRCFYHGWGFGEPEP